MANKALFQSSVGQYVPPPDAINLAGGSAYNLTSKQALAQYVMTGCLRNTFYADAKTQLVDILTLAKECDAKFVAQLAVVARERGYMKDTPALLLAHLSAGIGKEYVPKIFSRVVDNGKMLRNYVQIIRSGAVGRKSFGSMPKRLIQDYITGRKQTSLFRDSVGNNPSIGDIIKMVRPKPRNSVDAEFYRYLIGKPVENEGILPQQVQNLLKFRRGEPTEVTDIEFRLLTEKGISKEQWKEVIRSMGWHALRINLNAMTRAGVFDDAENVSFVAQKLKDKEVIKYSKVFPYQLFAAYIYSTDAPREIHEALQDAMEIATENVPSLDTDSVVVCQDVSGSMGSSITGTGSGQVASKISCGQVAALISSCILRTNKVAMLLPFDTAVHSIRINPRDSVMTNAVKLSINGGGTDCSVPMRLLASARGIVPKNVTVIYVSDNESWAHDHGGPNYYGRSACSTMMQEWAKFKSRCPDAKLVCIDLTPNRTTQAISGKDVLNIGGFSDQVFTTIRDFVQGKLGADHWIEEIEKTDL